MKVTKFTLPQIMAVLRKVERDIAVPAVCPTDDINTAGFCKWRSKYGAILHTETSEICLTTLLYDRVV